LDLISLGECLVEFTRRDDGDWHAGFAGDAVNVLVHAARLGRRCGFISCVGNDLFTSLIVNGLEREKIDIGMVQHLANRRNGLYFIDTDPRGEYTFHFWRDGSAATRTLRDGDLDSMSSYAAAAEFFLITGVTLAVMGEDERVRLLLQRVRNAGTRIVLDTNYRERLWASSEDYRHRIDDILPFVSIFLPSLTDIEQVWPERDLRSLCAEMTSVGVETIVVKNGANGVMHYDGGTLNAIPPLPNPTVIDTTGAGDAFNAGFLSALIERASLVDAIEMGQRAAFSVLSVQGALGGDDGS